VCDLTSERKEIPVIILAGTKQIQKQYATCSTQVTRLLPRLLSLYSTLSFQEQLYLSIPFLASMSRSLHQPARRKQFFQTLQNS
jgi:hypothetical protein